MRTRGTLAVFLILSVICGVIYPLLISGMACLAFPRAAGGSLIVQSGKYLGSDLIGQPFLGARFFWGRPSSTGSFPYNPLASAGSNFGPTNPALRERVMKDVERMKMAHGGETPVPIDLVTSSGSGLDPHISIAAAIYQVERVAKAREVAVPRVRALVEELKEEPLLGIFGETRVNVLKLNLALESADFKRDS